MTAAQAAGAGDAVGGLSSASAAAKVSMPVEMGAIGAGARHEFRMAVQQQCDIALLHGGGHRPWRG